MALPEFMQETEERIRYENQTTLDDYFTQLLRAFSNLDTITHNDVSNTLDTLNSYVATSRFGIDYETSDDHVESSIRAMVSDIYQQGSEHLFDDNLTRREQILAAGNSGFIGMSQQIILDRINNLDSEKILVTIKDYINEYRTATPDEQFKIASQLELLTLRAHSAYNLRSELEALEDDPYTLLSNHEL